MTTWGEFIVRLMVAFFLGAAIGMEKKLRRSTNTIKLTTLISVGTATYVIASNKSVAETNFLIFGISLICASMIVNQQADSLNIDTAILLWCAGIIGLLAGSSLFLLAYGSTLIIVIAKFLFNTEQSNNFHNALVDAEFIESTELESSSKEIKEQTEVTAVNTLPNQKTYYHCQICCQLHLEAHVLASMVQCFQEQNIILNSLKSQNEPFSKVIINADFVANQNEKIELQKIFQSLKSEIGVDSLSWYQVLDR